MPSGWVHATMDLIVFGRPYFDLHKEKDKAHETLSSRHRIIDHDWYQAFGRVWTLSDPFPEWLGESIQRLADSEGAVRAEEHMALNGHDYWDRVWDRLSYWERKYWESFFMWVLLHPEILKNWAGVDVLNGSIHRVVEGEEMWEACPEIVSEYERLRRYMVVVRNNDPILQEMLGRYG